jgi:sulfur transfer complex TusBCD TusB component (DsrH family)
MLKLDLDVFERRPLHKYQYTYYITLPSEFAKKNSLAKGTKMVFLAKDGVLIIVSETLYRSSIRVQKKIEEFFSEEDEV